MQSKKDNEMVGAIWNLITEQAQKQGLSFLLLMGMVFWFNGQNQKLSDKIDACNQSTIDIYQTQNTKLMQVLDRNSEAMENITRHLEHKK